MWVDTHTHLHLDAFDPDRDAVVQRARAAGVTRWVDPALDVPSARRALALAEQYGEGYFVAVGVHPNSVAQAWHGGRTLDALRELAEHPRVVAIGEIGLDYYRDYTPPAQQRAALEAQLALAAEVGLPVILHQRASVDDLLDMLADWVADLRAQGHPLATRPGVLHSFSGTMEQALRAVALGFFVGITGPVTFKNGATMRAVAQAVPLERLLVETDAPFMAPHPHRGKRNEPAWVVWVGRKVAEGRGLSEEALALVTTRNAEALFHFVT